MIVSDRIKAAMWVIGFTLIIVFQIMQGEAEEKKKSWKKIYKPQPSNEKSESASMDIDEQFIYIVTPNLVYKVDKESFTDTVHLDLGDRIKIKSILDNMRKAAENKDWKLIKKSLTKKVISVWMEKLDYEKEAFFEKVEEIVGSFTDNLGECKINENWAEAYFLTKTGKYEKVLVNVEDGVWKWTDFFWRNFWKKGKNK